jgi:hypothetical protein
MNVFYLFNKMQISDNYYDKISSNEIYYAVEIYFHINDSNFFKLHDILMKYDYDWKGDDEENNYSCVQIDIECLSLIKLLNELDDKYNIAYIVANGEYNKKLPALIYTNNFYHDEDIEQKIHLTDEEKELKRLAENRLQN